ncbi:hypothetical protein K432DRAFT_322570 [Lepidopterella palustris CBS 459.81]|uniref:Uncharacterized protein n=1 Tax=Lepidopterella palustris CBS 459.81 TaxID=1314670 RepID=A0A8E2JIA0_9PEZI|nr:hypothetical protein K432DRAFT_322570 [Lepidopterella palustris CBS 459.81]
MPHGITSCNFVRTILGTADVFVLAIGLLDHTANPMSPEEVIEAVAPWFIDSETFWLRMFGMAW